MSAETIWASESFISRSIRMTSDSDTLTLAPQPLQLDWLSNRLLLYRGFLCHGFSEQLGSELRLAIIRVEAIDFLLDVRELRIAQAGYVRVAQQHVGEGCKSLDELVFGLGPVTVAPGLGIGLDRGSTTCRHTR